MKRGSRPLIQTEQLSIKPKSAGTYLDIDGGMRGLSLEH